MSVLVDDWFQTFYLVGLTEFSLARYFGVASWYRGKRRPSEHFFFRKTRMC